MKGRQRKRGRGQKEKKSGSRRGRKVECVEEDEVDARKRWTFTYVMILVKPEYLVCSQRIQEIKIDQPVKGGQVSFADVPVRLPFPFEYALLRSVRCAQKLVSAGSEARAVRG